MKKLFAKKNNKGFSLVELIVVVAIMAVLMGVLVPTLIKKVETSRISKDTSALDEVKNAVEVTLADERFADASATGVAMSITSGKISLKSCTVNTGDTSVSSDDFWDAVEENLGTLTIDISSKLKSKCASSIKLNISDGHCSITNTCDSDSKYSFTIGGSSTGSSSH